MINVDARTVKYPPIWATCNACNMVANGVQIASMWLGRRMAQMLAGALPGRDTHVVAGAACAGKS